MNGTCERDTCKHPRGSHLMANAACAVPGCGCPGFAGGTAALMEESAAAAAAPEQSPPETAVVLPAGASSALLPAEIPSPPGELAKMLRKGQCKLVISSELRDYMAQHPGRPLVLSIDGIDVVIDYE